MGFPARAGVITPASKTHDGRREMMTPIFDESIALEEYYCDSWDRPFYWDALDRAQQVLLQLGREINEGTPGAQEQYAAELCRVERLRTAARRRSSR